MPQGHIYIHKRYRVEGTYDPLRDMVCPIMAHGASTLPASGARALVFGRGWVKKPQAAPTSLKNHPSFTDLRGGNLPARVGCTSSPWPALTTAAKPTNPGRLRGRPRIFQSLSPVPFQSPHNTPSWTRSCERPLGSIISPTSGTSPSVARPRPARCRHSKRIHDTTAVACSVTPDGRSDLELLTIPELALSHGRCRLITGGLLSLSPYAHAARPLSMLPVNNFLACVVINCMG